MSLMLTDPRKRSDAGYFRIGDVTLSIPPEQIVTNKDTNDEEVTPLRGRSPMYQKTGHSRWDVTVSWKALADTSSGEPDYSQWEDLRRILAIFKAAPFVEVENAHLRQVMSNMDPDSQPEDRMAFALRQLRIDTIPDVADGLQVTLTMSWFNFRPYSLDFGYLGDPGESLSADKSEKFGAYIDTWIAENLDTSPTSIKDAPEVEAKYGYPDLPSWEDQKQGTLGFNWRHYIALPRPPSGKAGAPSASAPTTSTPAPLTPQGSYQTLLVNAIAQAIRRQEGWKVGAETNGVRTGGTPAWRNHNPGNLRIPGTNHDANNFTIFASDDAGWQALLGDVNAKFRKYPQFTMRQFFDRYAPATDKNDPEQYSRKVLAAVNKTVGTSFDGTTTLSVMWNRAQQPPAADQSAFRQVPTSVLADSSKPVKQTDQEAAFAANVAQYMASGWEIDHWTDRSVFLFQNDSLYLTDEEHGEEPDDAAAGLEPVQISVVFVNNLVQVPLSGYQYPTYQHIGPAGTLVAIGMLSNGTVEGDLEPTHPGLQNLSRMTNELESQYQRLRGEWKAVSSIHRMQAVIVENQVLNMLGITGAMVKQFSTETMESSPACVQARINLAQYENIFEQVSPFRVKGVSGSYQQAWSELLNSGEVGKLAAKDRSLQPLLDFKKQRDEYSRAPVLSMIEDTHNEIDQVPMPIPLTAGDERTLRQAMTKPSVNTPVKAASSMLPVDIITGRTFKPEYSEMSFETGHTFASDYPEIADHINKRAVLTYNDYLFLTSKITRPEVAEIANRVDNRIRATPDGAPLPKMYDSVFRYRANNDPAFGNAIQTVEMVPSVKERFKKAVNPDGPGLDEDNQEHGAYRDLGLKSIETGGLDFNPGYYFVDHGATAKGKMKDFAKVAAKSAIDAANSFNRPQEDTSAMDVQLADRAYQESNAEAILKRVSVPYHSMARAFPTFKLLLIEEDNSGPFFMFDDFYSYGSVLSIEIIRYQDRPDTAVVQLTNFANLLSHRLFDTTSQGKTEKELSNLQNVPSSSTGGAVAGQIGGKQTAEENWAGVNRARGLDLTSGYDAATKDIPLQYYPLQTGSKVQVRMGFTNNPDELSPVFNGKVTQIEGDEILTVVCQGYMLELMDAAPEDLRYDGYANLSMLSSLLEMPGQVLKQLGQWEMVKSAQEVKNAIGAGAAYGGFAFMRDSAYTDTIMEAVLKTSGAKHFGHWQVGKFSSPYLKGFGWAEMASNVLEAAGASKLASLLNTSYDRSGENISINRFINIDGTSKEVRIARSMMYEKPLNIFPAEYHVPKDPNITPWWILQDVGRRYAEYILAVKQYGFPYGADATLVFTHPNDYWITRRPMADSVEIERLDKTSDPEFRKWWHAVGWKRFQEWARSYQSLFSNYSRSVLRAFKGWGADWGMGGDPAVELTKMIDQGGITVFDKVCDEFNQIAIEMQQKSLFIPGTSGTVSKAKRMQKEIVALRKDLVAYLQTESYKAQGKDTDPRPGDRIQPVRRWHLITHENIVHNGIRMNDQIFNAARVDRDVYKANAAIPNFHTRVLDCDKLIIEPELNVRHATLGKSYAQSFLRREVGKMYRGELVLTGLPEVEPYDVLLIYDPATGMYGPIEVDKVQHIFEQDTGYLTVVTPRALVIINEAMTAGLLAAFQGLMSWHELSALGSQSAVAWEAVKTVGEASLAATALAAVGILSGGWAVAVPLLVLATAKILFLADEKQGANPLFVAPLSRFGSPWVGGLNGWQLTDLHTLYELKFQRMWNFEIAPTIESFKRLRQIAATVT